MLDTLLIAVVALFASALTFFTGFGLGTLLLPAFALFFPAEVAVALAGVVHLLNGLFKLLLVGRHVAVGLALRFGVPAILAAWAGARLLAWLAALPPLGSWALGGRVNVIRPVGLAIAVLMIAFVVLDWLPRTSEVRIAPRYAPLGGLLAGFFGGLSGHQGAFRSMFLLRAGLTKESFIATGVAIAVVIDVARLWVYSGRLGADVLSEHASLLAVAVGAAFAGAFAGSRLLHAVTLGAIRGAVTVLLLVVALGLGSGLI